MGATIFFNKKVKAAEVRMNFTSIQNKARQLVVCRKAKNDVR